MKASIVALFLSVAVATAQPVSTLPSLDTVVTVGGRQFRLGWIEVTTTAAPPLASPVNAATAAPFAPPAQPMPSFVAPQAFAGVQRFVAGGVAQQFAPQRGWGQQGFAQPQFAPQFAPVQGVAQQFAPQGRGGVPLFGGFRGSAPQTCGPNGCGR